MLEDGFYWIQAPNHDPEVARLRDDHWWLMGIEESLIGTDLVVLTGERILPPTQQST